MQILGKVVAPSDVDDWKEFKVKNWLWFANVSGLDIHGNGQIDGQGAGWWNQKSNGRPTVRYDRRTKCYLRLCGSVSIEYVL